jgi:5-methyltetrahydrofolate corrinoid/iron sulfur protein methyltransferase
MEATDIWFDPLYLVIKGMQEKQVEMFEFIRQLKDMGFNSICGLSNASNMMPKHIRPIIDSVMMSMAIVSGLSSAIVNPCDQRMMETIKSADIIMNQTLYADSYLEI